MEYCKLIKATYNPTVRYVNDAVMGIVWIGKYYGDRVVHGKRSRVGVLIHVKSESIEAAEKWLNTFLIRRYKRNAIR